MPPPSDRLRRPGRSIAAVSIATPVVVLLVQLTIGATLGTLTASYTLHLVIGATTAGAVGGLILGRQARHLIGWLFIGISAASAVSLLSSLIGEIAIREAVAAGGRLAQPPAELLGPAALAAFWPSGWTWVLVVAPLFTVAILYFPDGRLPGRRWSVIAGLSGLATMILSAGFAGATSIAFASVPTAEVLAGNYHVGALDWVVDAGFVALALAAGGSVASLVVRFRRSRGTERQQVKWLAYGASMVALLLLTVVDPDVFRISSVFAIPIVPVCVGIAIVRHRLYDIDRIVSRSLAYAVVSVVLATIFAAMVVGLQAALEPFTQGQTLAVAASTLVVAGLFRPLHGRVQGAVNRRFDRARIDAERAVDALAGQLRNEIDPARIRASVLDAVDGTVRPATSALWLHRRRTVP